MVKCTLIALVVVFDFTHQLHIHSEASCQTRFPKGQDDLKMITDGKLCNTKTAHHESRSIFFLFSYDLQPNFALLRTFLYTGEEKE